MTYYITKIKSFFRINITIDIDTAYLKIPYELFGEISVTNGSSRETKVNTADFLKLRKVLSFLFLRIFVIYG